MEQVVFTINNLNLFYGSKQALFNLNLKLKKKHVIALIGPSGCGKSTFLRCLNRMNDLIDNCVIEGKIEFYNQDIMDEKQIDVVSLRSKVGMVFQKPNPFAMSIFDNVAYGPRCSGIKDKRTLNELVIKSLKQAALYDDVVNRLHESALSLSGGQQQRLCIARALAMQPEVILMDEPTSALDPISTSKIEQLISELKKDYTIIIVTHSMQQASRISDDTIFFLNGEVIEYDETRKLFQNPKDKRCEDYISGRFG